MESGRYEVYVTTFPERRQTWPLTTEGGRVLSWRADGREILVATLSGHIAAYPVSTKEDSPPDSPRSSSATSAARRAYSSAAPDTTSGRLPPAP